MGFQIRYHGAPKPHGGGDGSGRVEKLSRGTWEDLVPFTLTEHSGCSQRATGGLGGLWRKGMKGPDCFWGGGRVWWAAAVETGWLLGL